MNRGLLKSGRSKYTHSSLCASILTLLVSKQQEIKDSSHDQAHACMGLNFDVCLRVGNEGPLAGLPAESSMKQRPALNLGLHRGPCEGGGGYQSKRRNIGY